MKRLLLFAVFAWFSATVLHAQISVDVSKKTADTIKLREVKPAPPKKQTVSYKNAPVLYAIDGKRVSKKEVSKLSLKKITHVTILNPGSADAIKFFGEDGKTHRAILFTTKK